MTVLSENLEHRIRKLNTDYRNLWQMMLREESTHLFYEQLKTDILKLPSLLDEAGRYLIGILSSETLLNIHNFTLMDISHKELLGCVNADVTETMLEDVENDFDHLQERIHLNDLMQHGGHSFLISYNLIQNNIISIHQSNDVIDNSFVR